jgi:hypothetical protein
MIRNNQQNSIRHAHQAATTSKITPATTTSLPPDQLQQKYLRHLPEASGYALLVSLADKLHNARALLRDFRDVGDQLWKRFNQQDPQQHLWYYRSPLEVYSERIDNWMVDELGEAIDGLERAIDQSA